MVFGLIFILFGMGYGVYTLLKGIFTNDWSDFLGTKKKNLYIQKRRRNEDDFLNEYGYINNSAFEKITIHNSKTHK